MEKLLLLPIALFIFSSAFFSLSYSPATIDMITGSWEVLLTDGRTFTINEDGTVICDSETYQIDSIQQIETENGYVYKVLLDNNQHFLFTKNSDIALVMVNDIMILGKSK